MINTCAGRRPEGLSVLEDDLRATHTQEAHVRTPFFSETRGSCDVAANKDDSMCGTLPSFTDQAPHQQRHGSPRPSLVDELASQIVSLQKRLEVMEDRHQLELQDAVSETVQQMESRLLHGCARAAAQLTWNELHRTGLAGLYCGVIQRTVQPDAIAAVTMQCIPSTFRHAGYPHLHPSAAPPPPPRLPRSQQCPPPVYTTTPSLMMQPFVTQAAPPPPGLPPQPPRTLAIPRGQCDCHTPAIGQGSPLSASHRASDGAFSALAKPFSPHTAEWNSLNSIWSNDSSAAQALVGNACTRQNGHGKPATKGHTGVSMFSSCLCLPDSLPGSSADPLAVDTDT